MSDYHVDLDPVHAVLPLTVTAEIVTVTLAQDMYTWLKQISVKGGPYAAIYDLTIVKGTTIPVDMVRTFARQSPSVPLGRPQVIVGESATIYGLARLFQLCREMVYGHFEVVHTLADAYLLCECRPEDFTERL